MQRPTILVDLDNVVYDWTRTVIDFLYQNGALHMHPHEAYEGYSQWSLWEDWGMTGGEFMRWWRLGIEAGVIYGQGPVIPGAREALWALSDNEWDIHIATNRLTKFGLHDQVCFNTITWLRANNIPYRQLSLVSDKTKIQAEAIIDDRQDNMSEESHGATFHFPANHWYGETVTPELQEQYWEGVVETLGAGLSFQV